MLQIPTEGRLDYMAATLKKHAVRFPGKHVASLSGIGKATVSQMLNGKIPVSEKVWEKFVERYPPEDSETPISIAKAIEDLRTAFNSGPVVEILEEILERLDVMVHRFEDADVLAAEKKTRKQPKKNKNESDTSL